MSDERRCPRCHQIVPNEPELPIARHVPLHHCGRQLFVVDGQTGLWAYRRSYGEMSPSVLCSIDEPTRRGRPRLKTLYLQQELTTEIVGVVSAWGKGEAQ